MKITRAVVPSLFTVLNMFCGFLSIVNSGEGQFDVAAWFIILGGVFDSLDGVMARITKSSSEFGVEFDSLSDVVTFGAAPAFLVTSFICIARRSGTYHQLAAPHLRWNPACPVQCPARRIRERLLYRPADPGERDHYCCLCAQLPRRGFRSARHRG